MRFAIFMMVGPGDVEAGRLRTVARSLARHEPGESILAVVNDTGGPLPPLADVVSSLCEVVELTKTRPPSVHEHSRNILQALKYLAGRDDWSFAMKLDTDALVIAPFVPQVETYLAAHPEVGQVGRSDRACSGKIDTHFGSYTGFARRLARRIQVSRSPSWSFAQAFVGEHAYVRRLIHQAAANGAPDGLHCQGGAYAMPPEAVRRMDTAGMLDDDRLGRIFALGDDLMISVLVAALGMKITSQTEPGMPFALEPTGLPMSPAELKEQGYALIHSVKNDKGFTEAEVVRFFETHDGASPTL